jgi:hypothetical protein
VYAEDVTRDISMMDEIVAKWEFNLNPNQKLFLLIMRTTILPQLILKTKAVKEAANRTATNTARRAANRVSRKRKRDEIEQEIENDIQD